MSRIAIVYWSGTGHTEAMAQAVRKGCGGDLFTASEFGPEKAGEYDAIAMGCPAMGSEELEDSEFQPMYDSVKPFLAGKRVALFGSYDWGDGEWLRTWEEDCAAAGAQIVGTVQANNEPDDEALAACEDLGKKLA